MSPTTSAHPTGNQPGGARTPDLFDLDATTDLLLELLNTPSPTGFTEGAVALVERELARLGVASTRTPKGGLVWTLPGDEPGHVSFSGHADTLGAMVKAVRPNGRLGLTQLGSYDWATVEGAEVQVHRQPQHGQGVAPITGTVVNVRQSSHVWGAALRETPRGEGTLEVRLDERVRNAADALALGVGVGDFVSFDPGARLTPAGYIKGRHLDNKAAVALFLGVTPALMRNAARAAVSFCVTVYEEVGHGAASGIPTETTELIAVDMAAIGEGQTSSEHHVTLCVKDSSGPYDHQLGNRLRAAAQRAGVELRVDIYPYYSSDASAAWRAGLPCPAALIGPGVDASHAYERTHRDALEATARLMLAYLRV